jgi:hypothetical protein
MLKLINRNSVKYNIIEANVLKVLGFLVDIGTSESSAPEGNIFTTAFNLEA